MSFYIIVKIIYLSINWNIETLILYVFIQKKIQFKDDFMFMCYIFLTLKNKSVTSDLLAYESPLAKLLTKSKKNLYVLIQISTSILIMNYL